MRACAGGAWCPYRSQARGGANAHAKTNVHLRSVGLGPELDAFEREWQRRREAYAAHTPEGCEDCTTAIRDRVGTYNGCATSHRLLDAAAGWHAERPAVEAVV